MSNICMIDGPGLFKITSAGFTYSSMGLLYKLTTGGK